MNHRHVDAAHHARWAALRAPLAAAGAVLAAWGYVALVDPNVPGRYPVCPFRSLTGLDCPFCGGTRAAHALGHGDVGAALDYNVLVTLAIPVAIALWVRWAWLRSSGRPTAPVVLGPRLGLLLVGVLLAFMVVRNLPAAAYLRST
jgi:Protein of unknown function (DUF2752)